MHYTTTEETLDLAGLEIKLLRVTNIDDLFNRLIAKGEDHEDMVDDRLPYWADLWHASIGMGRYLAKEKFIKKGMTVTEIGCGLGLSGIVAGKLGADVTFSDYSQEALDFAKLNYENNVNRPANYVQMDWRNPNPELAADLVLAADVAYEERSFDYLLDVFRLLCKPGGRILFSEPNRPRTAPFLTQLENSEFEVRKAVEEVDLDEIVCPVNILELVRGLV